jgi:hypothetical protein
MHVASEDRSETSSADPVELSNHQLTTERDLSAQRIR